MDFKYHVADLQDKNKLGVEDQKLIVPFFIFQYLDIFEFINFIELVQKILILIVLDWKPIFHVLEFLVVVLEFPENTQIHIFLFLCESDQPDLFIVQENVDSFVDLHEFAGFEIEGKCADLGWQFAGDTGGGLQF